MTLVRPVRKEKLLVVNPKKTNDSVEIKPHWYNYYAGYSHSFSKGIIDTCKIDKNSVILDPWNGTGTTTLMASAAGYQSVGIDLNPVMKIIATAKQATIVDALSVEKIFKNVKSSVAVEIDDQDPLHDWFDLKSVEVLRKFEKCILDGKKHGSTNEKIDSLSASQCLMYTALFGGVRECLSSFVPSNPTWIKKPRYEHEKIEIEWRQFKARYFEIVQEMIGGIKTVGNVWPENRSALKIGSSYSLDLKSSSIDLVVTSPPYCTRIDYGVATLPELSIVVTGGKSERDSIRRSLIGTTTVPRNAGQLSEECGEECLNFVSRVKEHNSKASSTYYYKNFVQYFQSMKESVDEVSRVLKKESKFVCVVQDSFYKDIHCDLPKIISDMAFGSGFKVLEKVEFESKINMVNVNVKSKSYRKNNVAIETVLIFEK